MASLGYLNPRPTDFQNRLPPFPDFLELKNTFGCFKKAFSTYKLKLTKAIR
jgi:hypothetical protein